MLTSRSLAVGIGGGSGAGKTALTRMLADRLRDVCVLDLDSYYLDRGEISPETRGSLNYDAPDAFDASLLADHLRRLIAGQEVLKPRYSFVTHTRAGSEVLRPSPVVLVEGHIALWWENIRALLDLKVYVDAPSDFRLLRRIQRDVAERGRTVESVIQQYLESVRPMHDLYIEPTRLHADLVVANTGKVEDCIDGIILAIRSVAVGQTR